MKNMNNANALQNLGLSEKESLVYISLLELGKANVTEIARLSRLKRPTIYVLLEELRKKELVLKIPYTKKAIFIAKDPDAFFRESLTKAKEAYDTLSQLKAIHRKDNKVSTMYFEGDEGIKEALYYRYEELEYSEVVGFFAKATALSSKFISLSHQWRNDMYNKGITVRGIAPEHASLQTFRKTDDSLGQIFKTISLDRYSSDVSIDATNLFVRIMLFDINQAVIIENPDIVKTVKQIFELSWNNLK